MERILVAVDLPFRSHWQLESAIALSSPLGGSVRLVHVMPGFQYGPPHARAAALLGPTGLERGILLAEHTAELLAQRDGGGPDVEQRVLEGRAHAEILREAQRWRASLVILGGAGGRGWPPGLLGSVSLRILSRATVPVLLVHGRARTRPERILAVIDGSETTGTVLSTAHRWGRALGAEVDVVYALEQMPVPALAGLQAGSEAASAQTELMEQLVAETESILVESFPQGGSPGRHRPGALLYHKLPIAAVEGQYDLVILGGSAGRGSLELGAPSLLAAHGCPCSVLMVPARAPVRKDALPDRSIRFRRKQQSLGVSSRWTRSAGRPAHRVDAHPASGGSQPLQPGYAQDDPSLSSSARLRSVRVARSARLIRPEARSRIPAWTRDPSSSTTSSAAPACASCASAPARRSSRRAIRAVRPT
jgi:nucleotide-binding universal stress UspA family protein